MDQRALSWTRLGRAFRELEQYEDAVCAYRVALDLHPRRAETWHCLGVALMLSDQDDRAITAFRRAVELDATHGPARYNLAMLLGPDTGETAAHAAVLYRHDPGLAVLLSDQLVR